MSKMRSLSIILFLLFFILPWFIRLIERTLFHAYKWQLKEYRWDRYRDYLKERQGVWLLLHPWYWLGWILFFLSVTIEDKLYLGLLMLYVLVSGILSIGNIIRGRFRFPTWTPRSLFIVLLTLIILIAPPLFIRRVYSLLYGLGLPLLTSFIVFLSSFPANYFKRRTIEKAKQKIASLSNLKVIGITGSYGKSSTKEFLATILAAKYKVCKTPANQNTEIGVAKTILRDLKPEHEIFIVEMGAYRKGEIKAICDIVRPKIGIITAINEQHLALFGSLETIKQTKYELIEALPTDGVSIFNLDNAGTRDLTEKTKGNMQTYSLERPATVRASSLTVQPERLSFSLETDTEKHHIVVPLLGKHQAGNLLAAFTAAHALGMTLPEIAEATKNVRPPAHTMIPVNHPSGALIIDDSYSANPDGVLAALDHVKIIPRKHKIIVMMPMIELGASAKEAHRKVGERIADVCDFAIMTQKNFFSTIQSAAIQKGMAKEKILYRANSKTILATVQPYLNADSVILLENRISSTVLKSLT